ncbi:hypothetical protein MKW98_019673 [Papaver atlanticum]|uniref:Uncharacterized protein n=1 Tax=Papaver atlanticum TaxID=357466 RepID=A0AAD4SAJ9_9MAGN|nr:hypothetical protein MKW98_019673 [Papaver atlanticum]
MVEDLEAERKKLVEEFNKGRTLFDQMDNRATLAAWKPVWKTKGVGDGAIAAENSTLQDVIPSRSVAMSIFEIAEKQVAGYSLKPNVERHTFDWPSFLSDWAVKKMDGVPFTRSNYKEGLKDWEEALEGAGVLKKQHTELAEKQSDGNQTEMAAPVSDAVNAFQADTTGEPDNDDKRKEEFADVQSQIQNIYREIAGNPRFTGPEEAPKFSEDDLSLKKLVEFRSQLQRLQETSDRFRFLKVADLVDTVYDLCSVLGIDFINEVHQPSLIDSDLWVQSESINDETFSKLAKTIVDLKKDKLERLEKLQELARHLVVLWNLMDTSWEERSWFDDHVTHISAVATVDEVTLCEALSFARINDVKREIERLELKAINIKENNPFEMKLDPILTRKSFMNK